MTQEKERKIRRYLLGFNDGILSMKQQHFFGGEIGEKKREMMAS